MSLDNLFYGALNLSFWGYVIATIIVTQLTIFAVTIYLHRHQAHRALDLHPVVSHWFRFWLWLTTGMVTREWVAIHRKHHAFVEKPEDPHSPQQVGINKVLWEGTELYRTASKDEAMLEKYSHGTPNDWIERHVYIPYSKWGIISMFVIDLFLFGLPGISIWAIQMLWIPFFAAGVINGIGHYFGYRNFESKDASRNIVPWAFIIGGEELHNNHHSYATSAKLSVKWWEFDIGWLIIKTLSFFKLAKVKRLPPSEVKFKAARDTIDGETLKALLTHRLQLLSRYSHDVMLPVLKAEKQKLGQQGQRIFRRAKKLLVREEHMLNGLSQYRLSQLLEKCESLKKVYQFRQSLQGIWTRTAKNQKDLLDALQQWCKQAENSGIEALKHYATLLKQVVPSQSKKLATVDAVNLK